MSYKLESITCNTDNGSLTYKKLLSSDIMTGLNITFKKDTPLHHSIQMIKPDTNIESVLKLIDIVNIDAVTTFDITHLFLALQYSVINSNLKEVFIKIVDKKIKENTNFNDFVKNMNLLKYSYKSTYDNYIIKIKSWIGDDKFLTIPFLSHPI